jgi:hypothetical protein
MVLPALAALLLSIVIVGSGGNKEDAAAMKANAAAIADLRAKLAAADAKLASVSLSNSVAIANIRAEGLKSLTAASKASKSLTSAALIAQAQADRLAEIQLAGQEQARLLAKSASEQADRVAKLASEREERIISGSYTLITLVVMGIGGYVGAFIIHVRDRREAKADMREIKANVESTKGTIVTLEKNTNSIKDALVAVTEKEALARGIKQGTEEAASR